MKAIAIFGVWIMVFLGAANLRAQEFTITQVELNGESVVLHYDLVDTARNRFYTIHVFSSKDNFLNPLTRVKGDVGLEVKPGMNHKVVWDPGEFGAEFKGDVELEVRGKVYIPFVRFTNLADYKFIKRAKPTTLTWTGGTRQNILNFNLYKEDELVTVISSIANSGSYDLVIPRSVKPGDGYYFLVVDSKNKDQVMKTSSFTIKRKTKTIF
ncbi:MAG: GPI anchored serine-threonine rich family protein, partial [Cyclobacteriaceae bacterium]|nr:GPI anchored serine-threonine rich family protein [Cyclobacteriaceae bacterium]